MIFTIEVTLIFGAYAEEDWTGVIEIESSETLEELHFAILKAVGFDDDHLYEFFIARTERGRDKQRFDDENGKVFTTTLENIFPLPKGRKFYYYFDYGDSWTFQVKRSRKKPREPIEGIEYPRLITEIGKKPEQYPIYEDELA